MGLRSQLQHQLGMRLRESSRPELADLVGRGSTCPPPTAWAICNARDGFINLRWHDSVLLGLGLGPAGQRDRAGLMADLARRLGAVPGEVIEVGFRPLWLALESIDHWRTGPLAQAARQRASAGLKRIYESEALAGAHQAARGYPRLAQWAALAGALERSQ